MSEILTNNKYYKDIADTIRQMKGVATTYKPREMAGALRDMYSTEVEGVPPLTFPSNGNNLLNYRIDGANGGVGDRTENLFDFGEWSKNINANRDNSLAKGIDGITITANSNDAFTLPYSYAHNGVYKIYVKPNTNYLLSWVSNNNLYGRVIIFKNGISDNTHMVSANNNTTKYLLFGTDADTKFITLRFGVETTGNTITYSKIMLNEGSTALPYEPYGYKVPVVCGGTTTNIYLDEPIGANESKSLSDTNVNIPTINGTNILSIGTTVQPSNVYVQAPKGGSSGGDIDWSAIGYSEEPKSIKEDYNYAKNIYDNWDNTKTSYYRMFYNDTKLRIAPLVDTTNGRDFSEMFRGCSSLAEVPALNCSNANTCSSMFQNCSNLETVYITRACLNAYKMFAYCTNLKNVYLVNVLNASSTSALQNTFQGCLNLTDESLDNILQICINATSFQGTKTLAYLGITNTTAYPTSRIEALPHYQDFLDAGWNIGY